MPPAYRWYLWAINILCASCSSGFSGRNAVSLTEMTTFMSLYELPCSRHIFVSVVQKVDIYLRTKDQDEDQSEDE